MGKQKKKKKRHILRKLVLTVLLLTAIVLGIWYYMIEHVYSRVNYEQAQTLAEEPLEEEDGVINILLIGNDSRENGEDGRSDAMILVSISSRTKKIYLTSLLRDIYVDIPGHEGNRLNAAYSFGGAPLLLETIEKNFDIRVNRYVQVNFQAFASLIDAVGGVDLELTNEEVQWVNAYLVEYNILEDRPVGTDYLDETASGLLHLNGPQALAYTRNRKIGTDFARTERQRKVLQAVMDQLPASLLKDLPGLLDGILPNLTMNISKSELYSLSLQAARIIGYDVVQASIPLEGTYQNARIRDMAVLEVDFEKNKEYLRQVIYGEDVDQGAGKPEGEGQ